MPRGLTAEETGEDAPEVNELALLALFLAIVWIFGIGSVAGLILARRALVEIRESEGRQEGRSLAVAAIVAAVVGVLSLGIVILIAFTT